MLVSNPTPQTIAMFNQSKFGRAGYDGAKIIARLKTRAAAPIDAAPAEASDAGGD